jgi:arylsulfatase A-like enzyme/tetratricopeptide (TPR) repeat protein
MSNKKKKSDKAKQRSEQPAIKKEPVKPIRTGGFSVWTGFFIGILVVSAAGGFFWIRSKGRAITSGAFKNYNVLLITTDTTRADHLPMYGYSGVKTPELDKLAGQSVIFDNAISQAPLTLPSHTTMMTGLLPIANGVRDNGGFFVDKKITTLAELLKTKGYSTSAFVSSFVLDSRWQLDQGFDLYYDNFNLAEFKELNPQEAQRPAGETAAEFIEWLKVHNQGPFFSWVHFYDPHEPYNPPEPFKTEYASSLYDGEIAYMDENIGKVLRKLEELKLSEKTIIIVAGDHGESLGEHQEITHAMFVYNTTQHVPLLLHVPGGSKQRVPQVVRLIDIAPTVSDLVGVPFQQPLQGASLLPLINGTEKLDRPAYSESLYAELHYGWSPVVGITTKQYKFINTPKPELYDRIKDPGETRNIIQDKPSIAKVLKNDLLEMEQKYTRNDFQTGPQKMDPETEERLRSLGYIGGNVKATEESKKIDPKDKIHLARGIQQAFASTQGKEYQRALEEIMPVLQEDPDMTDAHFTAAIAYVGMKDYQKGIDELYKTIALKPDHLMALYNLGYVNELMGNLKDAENWYQKVLIVEPTHLYATLKLAHIYREMDQPEMAKTYYLRTIKSYTEFLDSTKSAKARSDLHSTLGEIYFGAGDMNKALENYQAAIAEAPDRTSLHYNLAQIYEVLENIPAAVAAYRREIELDPASYKSFNNLGLIYRHTNHLNEAVECFKRVVALVPDDERGYILLASTYKMLGRDQDANQVIQMSKSIRPSGR